MENTPTPSRGLRVLPTSAHRPLGTGLKRRHLSSAASLLLLEVGAQEMFQPVLEEFQCGRIGSHDYSSNN